MAPLEHGHGTRELKAAYLSLAGPLYAGDFNDFVGISALLLIDHLVIADCALEAVQDWFNPMQHMLAWYFGAPEEDMAMGTRTVTYLTRQDSLEGERLRAADHATLLVVLAGLASMGVTVHVVDEKASWMEHMCAVAQSSIVLSVFRDHVMNTVFMKWGLQSALMEFFLVTHICSRMQSDIS
ncbi:hypothetical protein EDB83DRAFT_2574515 [Lactarius deliciosus]|nr:hypothetical protein EDB83DRAFT_2574515 [Lactarius deliciosus]